MNVHERRRVAAAMALTAIAVPAIWMFNRADSEAATTTNGSSAQSVTTAEMTIPTTVVGLPPFLDNPLVIAPPAVVAIVRPETSIANVVRGLGSYFRYTDAMVATPCTSRFAPTGATVTVTNIDNGLTTTCINTLAYSLPPGIDIQLDTSLFTTIGDLNDAPVPVEISW